jgi:hypothetical protein
MAATLPSSDFNLEQAIKVQLAILGVDDVNAAIKALEDMGKAANSSEEEIEQATRVLKLYEQAYRDVGTAEATAADEALELARSQAILRDIVTEAQQELEKQADALKAVAGEEAAGTGFAGMSSNIFKAERAFGALTGATGGLARAGPMMESLLLTVGGPAGLGTAVIALAFAAERLAPGLEKIANQVFGLGEAAEHMKKLAEETERTVDAANKLAMTKPFLQRESQQQIEQMRTEFGGEAIKGGLEIAVGLRDPMMGLTEEELKQYKAGFVKPTEPAMPEYVKESRRQEFMARPEVVERMKKAREARAAQIFTELPTSRAAQGEIQAIAQTYPGLLPKEFAQAIAQSTPEAIARGKQEELEIEEQDPDQQYMIRQQAARAEHNRQLGIQRDMAAKRKRVEHALAKATDESVKAELDEEGLAEHEARKKAQDEKTAARLAQKEARDHARATDPRHIWAERQHEREAQALEAASGVAQAYGYDPSMMPSQIQAASRMAAQVPGPDLVANADMAFRHIAMTMMKQNMQMSNMNDMFSGWGYQFGSMMPSDNTPMKRSW